MRLLHTTELRFEEFFDEQIPPYAILSHRWEGHEVSYQELLEIIRPSPVNVLLGITPGSLDEPKYEKIRNCRAKVAELDCLQWVWIDTCCINKDSSAELSEAINSMWRWYEFAAVCFVYLSDVRMDDAMEMDVEAQDLEKFLSSRWFTRGWTLQELLAPQQRVLFYDSNWRHFGDRASLSMSIAAWTHIDVAYIKGDKSVHAASVAERMSWVSGRCTSRLEDMAYCMLGIFDVNMPLLYGEGTKAFMRLQLEIIRKSDDESIFAWRRSLGRDFLEWERHQVDTVLHTLPSNEHTGVLMAILSNSHVRDEKMSATLRGVNRRRRDLLEKFALHSGLLAHAPADFATSGHIKSRSSGGRFTRKLPYSMTNQGLQFYIQIYPSVLRGLAREGAFFDLALNCYEDNESGPIVIRLRKETYGNEEQFWRRYESRSFQGSYMYISVPGEEKVSTALYIRQDGL